MMILIYFYSCCCLREQERFCQNVNDNNVINRCRRHRCRCRHCLPLSLLIEYSFWFFICFSFFSTLRIEIWQWMLKSAKTLCLCDMHRHLHHDYLTEYDAFHSFIHSYTHTWCIFIYFWLSFASPIIMIHYYHLCIFISWFSPFFFFFFWIQIYYNEYKKK